MLTTFFKALVLGFSVAAPVGPIGVLCIQRTLASGRAVGLASGLGAATADTLYGLVAGLGVTAASAAFIGTIAPVRWLGCAYLLFLGVKTLRAPPAGPVGQAGAARIWSAWGSTFLLTITNPLTVLSFAAMFSAISLADGGGGLVRAPVLAGGVFFGSAAWWLLLSLGVDRLRSKVEPRHFTWVNRAAGALLIGLAGWTLVQNW